MCFINRFNLLNTNQFRCLAGQNTSDAPTNILGKAFDAINQNRVSLTVFSDFSNAFDIVDPEILLKKPVLLWLHQLSLDYCRSFLSNRSQIHEIKLQRSTY